jgi:hypothetical protein
MNEIEVVQAHDIVVRDEKYVALIEDINAAIVEFRKRRAYDTIISDHYIGRSIVDFLEQNSVTPTALVRQVANDLDKSLRSVWDSYSLWKEHPDIEAYINQVAGELQLSPLLINLTTLRQHALGTGEEPEFDPKKVGKNLIKKYGLERAQQVANSILNPQSA